MIINKFGGEIMADPHLVSLAAQHIARQIKKGLQPVIVVSALKGVTDDLLAMRDAKNAASAVDIVIKKHTAWAKDLLSHEGAKKVMKVLRRHAGSLKCFVMRNENGIGTKQSIDAVVSYGEKLSSILFSAYLQERGIPAYCIRGEDVGIVTDENFGDAQVLYEESAKNIRNAVHQKDNEFIPVIAGFTGRTHTEKTTTLGRGGSDTTACVLGAALNASKVILWKNVPGVLSADPTRVKNAQTVARMNYEEAEESGKVIHDKSMEFIRKENITVEVAYIQNPKVRTVITKQGSSKKGVKIISQKGGVRLMTIIGDKIKCAGALAEISGIITRFKINMALIRNTRDSLYIVIEKNGHDISSCEAGIHDAGYTVRGRDVAMITVIGYLSWDMVEKFNHVLHTYTNNAELGAFPYRNCVRLEACVAPNEAEAMVRIFHKTFIK